MRFTSVGWVLGVAAACGGQVVQEPRVDPGAALGGSAVGHQGVGGVTGGGEAGGNRMTGGATSFGGEAGQGAGAGGVVAVAGGRGDAGGKTGGRDDSGGGGIGGGAGGRGGSSGGRGGGSCVDGATNGDETDVDCGGARCPGCADGQICRSGADCASRSCVRERCGWPSCRGEAVGCGALPVPGGTFAMGRSLAGSDAASCVVCENDELPEHPATVSAFTLDRYEVTVGRFRRFVADFEAWRRAGHPAPGEGEHPRIPGSGWLAEWEAHLPVDQAALLGDVTAQNGASTWSDEPGEADLLPMNGLSWYVGFAFCVWDGGRLPTEAEWELAAAGGEENRLYPWGAEEPTPDHASYEEATGTPRVPVGSTPLGDGRWGHADLAGSLWEWVLDALRDYPDECVDCAALATTVEQGRALRGGCYANDSVQGNLRAANRFSWDPGAGFESRGLRCAR